MVEVVWSTDPTADAAGLLRQLAADVLALPTADVRLGRLCPRCGSSEHGRPVMFEPRGTGLQLSLARTDGLVAVAVSATGWVGVDVERDSATDFDGFAGVALHPAERDGTTRDRAFVWTRKEAVLKALGRGIRDDLTRLDVGSPDEPAHGLSVDGGVWLDDLEVPSGYAAAVAVVSDRPASVTVRRVGAAAPDDASRRR